MATNRYYTVKQQGLVCKMSLLMTCVSLGLIAFYLLTAEKLSIWPVLFISVMLVLPFGLGAIWTGRYRIEVQGSMLTVQKSFRLKAFQIDMSDITRAVYLITETRAGVNTKLTVHTASCGKFAVETLMDNGDRLMEQIKRTVAEEKIEVVHRSLAKK